MRALELPNVRLRELTLADAEDRYQWCLDKEVIKYLNMPSTYPPFSKKETEEWIKACMDKTNGYHQKAIMTKEGKHIGWVDLNSNR